MYRGNSHDHLMHILIVFPLQVCLMLTYNIYITITLQRETSFDCNVAEFGMGYGYVLDAPHLLAVTRLDYIPLGHQFADGNIPVLPKVSCMHCRITVRTNLRHKAHVNDTKLIYTYL